MNVGGLGSSTQVRRRISSRPTSRRQHAWAVGCPVWLRLTSMWTITCRRNASISRTRASTKSTAPSLKLSTRYRPRTCSGTLYGGLERRGVSDSLNYRTSAYILDRDGVRIESGDKMKILGFHFSSRPTVDAHIEVLKRRFRQRYWTLRHLKHNGFAEKDLVTVYTTMVRPVADYMMEVYHSMLTDSQDEALERFQTHALKCIYGHRLSGRKMRELAEINTLRERRIEYCDKFAKKCIQSDRFDHWFPKREGRATRNSEEFEEQYARCDRLFNSPLFYMRRRMNGKPGRSYGLRNAQYRQ